MTQQTKGKTLFTIQLKPTHARRLATLLRQASKKVPGKQEALNKYFGELCTSHGHKDPESCQMTIISNNMLVVEDYPSIDEIAAAHQAQAGGEPVDILLSKRALKALSFQERVSLCEEVGVHFSYLEAVLEQPANQQSSLTATAFLQVVHLAAGRHKSVAKVLKGGEQV